jgi:hypothetical protein
MPAIATLYFPSKVHAVQVRVHGYLHSVSVNLVEGHAGVESLEFRSLVTELKRGTFPQSSNWVPLPEEYLKLRYAAVRGHPAALSQRGPVRPPPHALACRHLPAIAWNPCQLRSPGSTTQARTLSSAASPSGRHTSDPPRPQAASERRRQQILCRVVAARRIIVDNGSVTRSACESVSTSILDKLCPPDHTDRLLPVYLFMGKLLSYLLSIPKIENTCYWL